MVRAVLFVIAVFVSSRGVAVAESPDRLTRAELQEDICAALAEATSRPGVFRDNRDDRVSQLCERYRKRYGDWPDDCCMRVRAEAERANTDATCEKHFQAKGAYPPNCISAQQKNWPTSESGCQQFYRLFPDDPGPHFCKGRGGPDVTREHAN